MRCVNIFLWLLFQALGSEISALRLFATAFMKGTKKGVFKYSDIDQFDDSEIRGINNTVDKKKKNPDRLTTRLDAGPPRSQHSRSR